MHKKNTLNEAQSTYLDLARALAAFSVLYGHAATYFVMGSAYSTSEIEIAGVMVFFLLSGFLISYTVFQKFHLESYTFKGFFIDRFSRIYAAYFPALVFVWLIDSYTRTLPVHIPEGKLVFLTQYSNMVDHSNLPTWISNLFMLQDYPVFQVLRRLGLPETIFFFNEFGSATPFWTISIEWWIYMLFGYVTLCLARSAGAFGLKQLAMLGFLSLVPFYYLIGGPIDFLSQLWIIGMIASLLFVNFTRWFGQTFRNTNRRQVWLYVGMTMAVTIIAMVGRLFSRKFDLGEMDFRDPQFGIFVALAIFVPLPALGTVKKVPVFLHKFITFIAGYSYSLYLVHTPVIVCLYIKYPGHDYDHGFYWLATSIAHVVAITFWFLFERHYRALARWIKQWTATPAVQQPVAA
jgi:peptidoglycan/LPS O-acetylase OafA/YrhL